MKYKVTLSIDNNRYGHYFKRYVTKTQVIEADNPDEAYETAAANLIAEMGYRSVTIKHRDGTVSDRLACFKVECSNVKSV
jgi:hypothetical protein